MTTEISQIVSTVYQKLIGKRDEAVCKPTHPNHPSILWAGECQENMQYTLLLGLLLCSEYKVRYGKDHKSHDVISYVLKIFHAFHPEVINWLS